MASINDWARKAAERIDLEYQSAPRKVDVSIDRVAAIVAVHAEPLLALVNEARRTDHDSGCEVEMMPPGEEYNPDEVCTCSAKAWNQRIDEALAGRPERPEGTGRAARGTSSGRLPKGKQAGRESPRNP